MEPNPTESADLLSILLKNTEEGVLLYRAVRDASQTITDFSFELFNEQALRFVPKEVHGLRGRTMLQVFPGIREAGLFDAYCGVVNNQEPFRTEQFYDHDGLNHWFKIVASATHDHLLVTFRDITEYKQIILENERSKQLYTTLVNALPGIDVALITDDQRFAIAKGAPLTAFGHAPDVPSGARLFQDIPHDVSERFSQWWRQHWNGKPARVEVTFEQQQYQLDLMPLVTEQEKGGALLVAIDVSIYGATDTELRNQLYELESTKESLEQFAYVASHDLQEPLRKIRAFGDRLSAKYSSQLAGSGQDYIARMQNAAERMQQLIDDLLQYSRVGRTRGELQAIDLNDLLGEVVETLDESIAQTQAKIIYEGLPTVEGEKWQLRQLFQNLLSNAIKFRKADQPPVVTIRAAAASPEQLSRLREETLPAAPHFAITVSDNGIGFDEKYLDRIFAIFQRLHGRSEYKGTGIGLAICQKIVESYHGTIYAQAAPDQGAAFCVVLPETQPSTA
ncbi:MAG: ATP-binding protein [Tunicatimonas sp.]